MGIERSVVEHEPHLGRIGFDLLELAALQIAPQLLQLPGRLREVGVDGIELLNGGKVGRLALPNQRAFGHQCATDTAADRRADAGIVEIELKTEGYSVRQNELERRDGGTSRGDAGARSDQRACRPVLLLST